MSTVNAFIRGPIFNDNYQYKIVIVKGYQDLQSQLIYPNTKYVIKHNFDLNNESVEIPSNCIIAVDGGSLSNGTLVGNNSILLDVNNLGNILDNITQSGTWKESTQLSSISIGEVTTGSTPSVTNVGDNHNAVLNFVFPEGKSAYQSYLDTTEDNPPLSEEDWINSMSGGNVDQKIQNAINPLNTTLQNTNNEVNTLKSTVQTIQNNILGEYYAE